MNTTLYGITNCDTMKKARQWLDHAGIDYTFHDYKKAGLDPAILDTWINELGFEALLNRRGTTYRKLPDDVKASIDEASARNLMLENLSIIKRPVLDTGKARHVGFTADDYSNLFS